MPNTLDRRGGLFLEERGIITDVPEPGEFPSLSDDPAARPIARDLPVGRIRIETSGGTTVITVRAPHSARRPLLGVAAGVVIPGSIYFLMGLPPSGDPNTAEAWLLLGSVSALALGFCSWCVWIWAASGPLASHEVRVTPGKLEFESRVDGGVQSGQVEDLAPGDVVAVQETIVKGFTIRAHAVDRGPKSKGSDLFPAAVFSLADSDKLLAAVRRGLAQEPSSPEPHAQQAHRADAGGYNRPDA
jgi:hypothetical protein